MSVMANNKSSSISCPRQLLITVKYRGEMEMLQKERHLIQMYSILYNANANLSTPPIELHMELNP